MPNADEVADYLAQHPDFFAERGALLANLRLPEEFATPFHERQAQALRERQTRLDRMLETVKANQNLEQELHEFAVDLLATDCTYAEASPSDEAAAIDRPAELLTTRFDLSAAAVFLDHQQNNFEPGVDYAALCSRVEHLGGACDDRVSPKLTAALFPPAESDTPAAIASCAFVPLLRAGKRELRGVLVLGDADRARFQPGMGVLFIDRIGQLVSAYLHGCHLL